MSNWIQCVDSKNNINETRILILTNFFESNNIPVVITREVDGIYNYTRFTYNAPEDVCKYVRRMNDNLDNNGTLLFEYFEKYYKKT